MKKLSLAFILGVLSFTLIANNVSLQKPEDSIHKFVDLTNEQTVITKSFSNPLVPLPYPVSKNDIRTIVFQAKSGSALKPALLFNNFSQMFIVVDVWGDKSQKTGFVKYDRIRLTTTGKIINDVWAGPSSFSPSQIPQVDATTGLNVLKKTFPNLGNTPFLSVFSVYKDLRSFDMIYDYTVKNSNGRCDDYLYDTKTKNASFGMADTTCHFTLPSDKTTLTYSFHPQ